MFTGETDLAGTPSKGNGAVLSRLRIAFRGRLAIAPRQRTLSDDSQGGGIMAGRIVFWRWGSRTPGKQRKTRRQR